MIITLTSLAILLLYLNINKTFGQVRDNFMSCKYKGRASSGNLNIVHVMKILLFTIIRMVSLTSMNLSKILVHLDKKTCPKSGGG